MKIVVLASFVGMSVLCAWLFSMSAHMGMVSLVGCAPSVMSIVAAVPPAGAVLSFVLVVLAALFFVHKNSFEIAGRESFSVLCLSTYRIPILRFLQELFSRGILHPRLYAFA